MPRATIAFATSRDEAGLTADDRLAFAPLEELGCAVAPWIWDEGPPPAGLDLVVVRSCWDYHRRPAEFLAWIDALAGRRVANPPAVLRWNLDKRYLAALADAGATIPRTIFLAPGQEVELAALLAAHELDEVVIKPAVSLSAHETWRSDPRQARAHQPRVDALLRDRGVLVQSFVPEVLTEGELSLVFLGGEYSHAVRKRPRPGDFRVQVDHGGTREACEAPAWVVGRARACLAAAGEPLLYARVDGVVAGGEFVVMELELIDPVLFLGHDRAAPRRFAAAIAAAADAHRRDHERG